MRIKKDRPDPGRAGRARLETRRALLRRLLGERVVSSQVEVLRLLRDHGHGVTQATASRDLVAIGAAKRAGRGGREGYRLTGAPPAPEAGRDELARLLREFVLGVSHSANLAVVRTSPGAAATVASALDRSPVEGLLGTLAGDDTILIIARNARGGAALASRIERILEGMS
jgi:transcriptional regulator of arginine metabolism